MHRHRSQSSRYRALVLSFVLLLTPSLHADSSERIVDYLEKYHKLSENDIAGRIRLADWCKLHDLHQQRADLLIEVLKLDPRQDSAYRDLLEADLNRFRPVDKEWAERLKNLIDNRFSLTHSQHFTVVSDCDERTAKMQADAMEDTYRLFYLHAARIGLRPMPPEKRLVCILFEKFDDYQDFQKRFEGLE